MKKIIIIFAAIALLASCNKELEQVSQMASFTVTLDALQTKAAADGDGKAAFVDEFILQVYDASGSLYYQKTNARAANSLSTTFEVLLTKKQAFTLLFWADKAGSYDTKDLREVTMTAPAAAGLDSKDAFSACYELSADENANGLSKDITLTRPLAQINIIATDLKARKEKLTQEAYAKFEPKNQKVSLTVPAKFNVETAEVSEPQAINLTEAGCYGNYSNPSENTTVFMGYVFAAAAQELADMTYAFELDGNADSIEITNVPYRRNYRTNLKGSFFDVQSTWTVTIDPDWQDSDFNKNF